jgi:hypothetical protein
MPNTFTDLVADAYKAASIVPQELTGFIGAVTRDASFDRAAIGETVRVPVAPASSAIDFTPAMAFPSAAYQTIDNVSVAVTKSRAVPFSWQGEESAALGPNFLTIKQDQILQAIRTLTNEMETDLALACSQTASRAYGTAATTPFASTLVDLAQAKKILDDNGVPSTDRHFIMDTTAGVKFRTLTQLTNVNQAGDSTLLRSGMTSAPIFNFAVRETGSPYQATAGTGASYQLNGALAVGATTVTVDTGSGTILAGDVVTIGNHKYIAATALAANVFTVSAPGIREVVADNTAITVSATSTRNIALRRSGVVLAARLPNMPQLGDMATDSEIIPIPELGLQLEVARYAGLGMETFMVRAAWGVKVIDARQVAVVLG